MRWIFVLLLLINALYFGWHMQKPSEKAMTDVLPANVSPVRMLSEVDVSLLLPRQNIQESGQSWCQVVSGLKTVAKAIELQQALQQRGVLAELRTEDKEQPLAYELIVDRPVDVDAAEALLANLEQLDINPEAITLNGSDRYIVGRFGSRTEANSALDRFVGLFTPVVYQVVSKDVAYQVWVSTEMDDKTFSKINELSAFFPRGIKIEKKVCKGVASAGVRD